ncbi:hypothetical protein SmJEL517_g01021 [Synchytrium microbalum]|uniref:G-patch domain-containing protein n=1 Tax=Synchytrium microbalum TaxID=1806994 RepID=A0A507CCS9_9FUNG|nr:uncharacterized protein SmJEL517_g01021 [Synchytrium microbalum]TPX36979.1 hypothetical protein SmJEL517_g01021 [Synchytrium microbalum]
MGLAERRTKQRFGPDPRNTKWSQDKDKFGQKMLEKFGWTEGKGLGANEDGAKEHISLKFKQDKIGIGAGKRSGNNWLDTNTAYSDLLASLNQKMADAESPTASETTPVEEQEETPEKPEVPRFGRLYHRQKFLRNKTVSNYDAADLSMILGTKPTDATVTVEIEVSEMTRQRPVDDWEDRPALRSSSSLRTLQAFTKSTTLFTSELEVPTDDIEPAAVEEQLDTPPTELKKKKKKRKAESEPEPVIESEEPESILNAVREAVKPLKKKKQKTQSV